jgi:hypothetical protein
MPGIVTITFGIAFFAMAAPLRASRLRPAPRRVLAARSEAGLG